MPITLTLSSGDTIQVDTLTDLASNLATELLLGGEYLNYLNSPIRSVPSGLSTNIQYASGNQNWVLGTVAPVSFSLSGGVTGKIAIVSSNSVFSYTNSFPTEVTLGLTTTDNSKRDSRNVPGAAGKVYVCVELDFTIQGGVAISYQQGLFGLSGSANGSDTVQIAFYKQCRPDDLIGQAIASAMADLVLPFHAETLNRLQPGDFLRHTANANLQLGLGANIGFKLFSYANQWVSGIPGVANSPTLTTGIKPNVQAGAKLAYSFGYGATFDQLVWKDSSAVAHLHLYRSKVQNQSLDLNVGISAQLNATASTSIVQAQVASAAKNTNATSDFQNALNQIFTRSSTQTSRFSSEINSKIATWLTPINKTQQITLDAKIASTNDNFLLLNFTVYLDNPAWTQAWSSMCNGRYQDAVEHSSGSVDLDPGSGLELLYSRTASLTLNFFGQWIGNWSTSTISNSSLIYSGNNIFHLITADGMQRIAQINKSSREVDVYFSSDVNLSSAKSAADPNFNIVLRAVNDPEFGVYIANFVGLLTSGQSGGGAARDQIQASANKANTTQVLQLIFKASKCATLRFSPTPTSTEQSQPDSDNYDSFAWACGQIMDPGWAQLVDDKGNHLSYDDWSNWNRALISVAGQPVSPASDRTESGPYNGGVVQPFVEENWPGISPQLDGVPLQAASEFMNLCQDLQQLSTATTTAAPDSWQQFTKHLVAIVNRDISWDFVAPAALALAHLLAQAGPQTAVGPAPGLEGNSSIAFTMTFA